MLYLESRQTFAKLLHEPKLPQELQNDPKLLLDPKLLNDPKLPLLLCTSLRGRGMHPPGVVDSPSSSRSEMRMDLFRILIFPPWVPGSPIPANTEGSSSRIDLLAMREPSVSAPFTDLVARSVPLLTLSAAFSATSIALRRRRTAPSSLASSAKLTARCGPGCSATAIFLYRSLCTRSFGEASKNLLNMQPRRSGSFSWARMISTP